MMAKVEEQKDKGERFQDDGSTKRLSALELFA
jgi:hypothetical protein